MSNCLSRLGVDSFILLITCRKSKPPSFRLLPLLRLPLLSLQTMCQSSYYYFIAATFFLGFSPTSPIALPRFVLDVTAPHPSHAPPAFHRVPFWDHYSSLPTSLPSQASPTFTISINSNTPMTPNNCLFLYPHPTTSR